MATEPAAQRVYRAACPQCGAPVEFRSPASAFAVCSFCRSTVVRDGDALRKIGQSAELFDDHSPLQLGTAGRYQGLAFTLVGRLQYRYAEGTWNEWHVLFEGTGAEGGGGDGGRASAAAGGPGRSGWLSEDNGRHVIAFDAPLPAGTPAIASLRAGAEVGVGGQRWSVASVVAAQLIAAQGELPVAPNLARAFTVADLRNPQGEVGTLDDSEPQAPRWSVGRSVALDDLALTGLVDDRGDVGTTWTARAIDCPNCGAALEIQLAGTRTLVCRQCHSVIDLSGIDRRPDGRNLGADLAHYAQHNGLEPMLPLGSVGTLALGSARPLPWQVVGYVERCEVPAAGDETADDADDTAQSFWREYLLYHRSAGFAFIVDAEDGWSWSAPITGAPEKVGDGAKYQGVVYRRLYAYTGMVTYVLGEFYWQVTRGQRTANVDFQGTGTAAARRLNREATHAGPGDRPADEVVWSAGETLTADQVLQAFRLAPDQRAALRRDALPTSLSAASIVKIVVVCLVLLPIVLLLFRCSGSAGDCDGTLAAYGTGSSEYQSCLNNRGSGAGYGGYRTGGGAFGGYSSGGGGHK